MGIGVFEKLRLWPRLRTTGLQGERGVTIKFWSQEAKIKSEDDYFSVTERGDPLHWVEEQILGSVEPGLSAPPPPWHPPLLNSTSPRGMEPRGGQVTQDGWCLVLTPLDTMMGGQGVSTGLRSSQSFSQTNMSNLVRGVRTVLSLAIIAPHKERTPA